MYQARVATRERAAAEGRLREVRELTNTFVFEVHDAIAGLPGSTPARRLVVERALEYLERISHVKTDDPALRRDLAAAYERVARVQGGYFESHLGDTEGARSSLGLALALREALAVSRVPRRTGWPSPRPSCSSRRSCSPRATARRRRVRAGRASTLLDDARCRAARATRSTPRGPRGRSGISERR